MSEREAAGRTYRAITEAEMRAGEHFVTTKKAYNAELGQRLSGYAVFLWVLSLLMQMPHAALADSCTGCGTDCRQSLEALSQIPDVKIEYFDVYGQGEHEVRESLNQRGPADYSGKRGDAYTAWNITWSWPFHDKKPVFPEIDVRYEIRVTLPDWSAVNEVSPDLRGRWCSFIRHTLIHEMGHVKHVTDSYLKISSEVVAAAEKNGHFTPKEANNIAEEIINEIRQMDINFDKITDGGRLQGVRFGAVEGKISK